jgi:hypothetical protein
VEVIIGQSPCTFKQPIKQSRQTNLCATEAAGTPRIFLPFLDCVFEGNFGADFSLAFLISAFTFLELQLAGKVLPFFHLEELVVPIRSKEKDEFSTKQ